MGKIAVFIVISFSWLSGHSQSNNNGKLDLLSEFTTYTTVPFTMPDGVKLMTDVYLPITSDNLMIDVPILGKTYKVEIIPKGTQLFVYDKVNGKPNPNKFQLPLVFTRTPYNKGSYDKIGVLMCLLGYGYALQDMRGRFQSEGVYFPMYSDAWAKADYHPKESLALDISPISDPHNCIYHEDGKNSIQFIKDSLFKNYDLNGDGIAETKGKVYNGSIAMFGSSALGNTQYQAAASMKNDVTQDGLKGLMPIVANAEYFNSTIQHNGVFRKELVAGWIERHMKDVTNANPEDNGLQNSIHSNSDYGSRSKQEIIDLAIDEICSIKDKNGFSPMYPNYNKRADIDCSVAKLNGSGKSDINGSVSRYTNIELPIYHLTGWWDIFIDGQIETYNQIMKNTSAKTQSNQKLVIGPWTHQTIGMDSVADQVFLPSVNDLRLTGDLMKVKSINELFSGELAGWLRYLLNYDPAHYLGEPQVLIPESKSWQTMGAYKVRIPSKDLTISYSDFMNFVSGFKDLQAMPFEVQSGSDTLTNSIDIPTDSLLRIPGSTPFDNPVVPPTDFSKIPNVRFYVPGPVNDGIDKNRMVGNYWKSSDKFPLTDGIKEQNFYLHTSGNIDNTKPSIAEAPISFPYDPDNPVNTAGGGNLSIPIANSGKNNAGPINYASPDLAPLTMNRPDVLKFESDLIKDSLSIIGIPKAKIYVSSKPDGVSSGPTDADFFVRILDVYPDGREFFVVEGAVNGRARDYAKSLAENKEDINAAYTNINIGQTYDLEFKMLPIAYSFGHGHKVKVLISSSNWPRYQANPGLPIQEGEFFRREPNDGKTYMFNGTAMSPRKSTQTIFFSPDQASQIILPVYGKNVQETENVGGVSLDVFPNPLKSSFNIQLNKVDNYTCVLYNSLGQKVLAFNINDSNKTTIDIKNLTKGVYILEVSNNSHLRSLKKLVKI